MDIWKILDLEATKDKAKIKRAYRTRLAFVNPEDDPEGFMELRAAFEAANAAADREDASEEAENAENALTPLEAELTELYADFYARIDAERWKSILSRSEFIALDTGEECQTQFLEFLMDHFFVPQSVFRIIDESLGISVRRKELIAYYPENFIEHIINNAKYMDRIDYYLFDRVGEDVDEFLDLYYALDSALTRGDEKEFESILKKMKSLDTVHPFLEMSEKIFRMRRSEDPEEKQKLAEELSSLVKEMLSVAPDQVRLLIVAGDLALGREALDDAWAYYEKAYKLDNTADHARLRMADIELKRERFEASRDIYIDLLEKDPHFGAAYDGMVLANEGLMQRLREEIKNHPEEEKPKIELVWCLYRNSNFAEAKELLESFTPTEAGRYEYYNLFSRNCFYLGEYEKALLGFGIWKQEIEKIPVDTTDPELIKRKNRYPFVHYYLAECYLQMKNYEMARENLDFALEKEYDERVYAMEALCRLEFEMQHYEAAIKACEQIYERELYNYTARIIHAKSLYCMGEFSESLDAFARVTLDYPYFQEAYEWSVRIFGRFERFGDAKEVIDSFEKYGERFLPEDPYVLNLTAMTFHVAGLYEREIAYEDKNLEKAEAAQDRERAYKGKAAALACLGKLSEAKKVLEACAEEFEEDVVTVIDGAELLLRMGEIRACGNALEHFAETCDRSEFVRRCYGNLICFYGNEGLLEDAHRVFLKTLEVDASDFHAYRSLAYVYLEHGRYTEAAELFQKALELDVEQSSAIAGLYALALSKCGRLDTPEGKRVVQLATEQLAEVSTGYQFVKRAEFLRGIGNFEEALSWCERAIDTFESPYSFVTGDYDAWFEKGNVLSEMGRHREACEAYREAIRIYGHLKLVEERLKKEEKLIEV